MGVGSDPDMLVSSLSATKVTVVVRHMRQGDTLNENRTRLNVDRVHSSTVSEVPAQHDPSVPSTGSAARPSCSITGSGRIAEHLRSHLHRAGSLPVQPVPIDSAVVVVGISNQPCPITEMSDTVIETVFEEPMRRVVRDLQDAFRGGCKRIVVVVPTIAMSGGRELSAQSALAEAVRVLVKSAARQWGASGVTVNAVAIEPEWFDVDAESAGPISIAVPSLGSDVPSSPEDVVAWLCSSSAGSVTGQTVVCDRGQWM